RHDKLRTNKEIILQTLKKKCEFKNIPVPTMDTLINRAEQEELEAEWENMLAHQMSSLPDFDQFWTEIPQVMEWLHNDFKE
ncbi:MAG: hypothetical protein GY699_05930, partial [Desulfobacteraceae bacterium]|nr:hypothetical protein [Desulfobacteraceae bacterium]